MSCRPNASPDSAKVWLLPLLSDFSLHILRFIHVFFFSTAVFFLFSSRLFLAYPQHHSSLYYTQPPYARFVSSFHFLYAVHQHLQVPSHMPARKTSPDKTHNFYSVCFKYM